MAGAAILDFWNSKILLAIGAESMPNFVKIGQSVAKISRFFRFFKMGAAAILDCRIHNILFADGIWREQTHHCTKFCQNRSFRYGDIVIFRIFKVAAAAILDF